MDHVPTLDRIRFARLRRRLTRGGAAALVGLAALVALPETASQASAPPPTCGASSSIRSNFDGTPIPGGSFIWFSAVGKVKSPGGAPVTFTLTNANVALRA